MSADMRKKLAWSGSEKSRGRHPVATVALAIFALLAAGHVQPSLAQQPSQATFPSAEEASRALLLAVQAQDERALTQILGAGKELVSSDDQVQDNLDRAQFVQKFQEMHRLVGRPDGTTILYIGAENWPFPIPLVWRKAGWRFDPDAGRKEVLFRRIGENEISAIAACQALVSAENTRGRMSKQTASSWAHLLADAKSDRNTASFDGYYFRILTSQDRVAPQEAKSNTHYGKMSSWFACTAYPAAYRSSGVMTFIVTGNDLVYEKDLGPNTVQLASVTSGLHLDPTWKPVDSELRTLGLLSAGR
jgi:hypothetical protein